MHPLAIAGFVAGGFIAAVLVVLGLRGRFGTPAQQGDYELYELAHSSAVPSGARTVPAVAKGHDADMRQIVGAGVLWRTADDVGFVLRRPRRTLVIPRPAISAADATDVFVRPGLTERVEGGQLLVVTWDDPRAGRIRAAFELDDAAAWSADLSR